MSTVDPPDRTVAGGLVGRVRELELIRSFLDGAATHGGALLLSGEPGMGTTVLLDAAAEIASATGTWVLPAAGVEFEADLGYSGLNQVLLPLAEDVERLRAVHRDALSVALGLGDGPAPDRLVVSTATVVLLRQAAAARPLLVVVDDLSWLDRSSAGVLGFVARRLTGSRVGFLAGSRSDAGGYFERGGLPEHQLQPLDDAAAADLVGTSFPNLAPSVRQRLLAEAQGNPLAILELPAALSSPQRAALQALPTVLPLSRRLEDLFASRVKDLPAPTRQFLLLTALDGGSDLRVLQAAASAGSGLADLAPAERARLVHVDEATRRVAFRHPLIRSAIVELSTSSERRRAHRSLADLLTDQPERRASHLAEATVEPDEQVAGLLEQVAHRVLQRGDGVGAVAALIRAADLSPGGSDRGRRLAEAAYIGADVTGELRNVSQLLVDARQADPESSASLQAAVAAAYLLINGEGDVDTAHRLLVGAIETQVGRYDAEDNALIEALHTLMLVCFFGGRPELWETFHAAIARLSPQAPLTLSLCSKTYPDPVRTAAPALEPLTTTIGGLGDEVDPARIVRIGMAAFYVDRLSGCRDAFWRVVRDGREGGAVASAIHALMLLCFDDFLTGQWDDAQQLAHEGLALCETHGYRLLAWPGRYGLALLAAARGDYDTTRRLTDEMTRWGAPRGVRAVQEFSCHARALAALGRGDYEDAYQQAAAVSPPGTLASHVAHALWVAMDLVEAATRTNRHAEAAAHVAAMRDADVAALSPRLALLAGGSAAIAAPDHDAAELFERVVAPADVDRWPFDLARVQLAYGERLRRARASTESRPHLAAALDTFQRLGARPWASRARNELRATGHTRAGTDEQGSRPLTPQERQIAQLAAAGLTNKQIGERLFLSHRTVGAHLYRVFPKLGVTSRAGLRDALASLPPP